MHTGRAIDSPRWDINIDEEFKRAYERTNERYLIKKEIEQETPADFSRNFPTAMTTNHNGYSNSPVMPTSLHGQMYGNSLHFKQDFPMARVP